VIEGDNVRASERESCASGVSFYAGPLGLIIHHPAHTSKCINDRKSERQKKYRLVKKTLLNREIMQ
jgi:hypothetical protein